VFGCIAVAAGPAVNLVLTGHTSAIQILELPARPLSRELTPA
jgi:hypothetical protein